MAAPSIGTTISEAYSEGLDRIGTWAAPAAVVADPAGVIGGAIAQAQRALVPDLEDITQAIIGGDLDALSSGDARTIQLLSVLAMVVSLVISIGAMATFAGRFHRERHGAVADVPTPQAVIPEVFAQFMALMPRIAMMLGLLVLGQLLGAFSGVLGGFVALAGAVVAIYLGIRWIYAPIISGAGEASGDAAFDRSAEVVEGSWWATLGTFIVISIATMLPVGIVAAIVGGILPGAFLSAFGNQFITTFGLVFLYAAALDSAWAQVEGGHDAGSGHAAAPVVEQQPPVVEPPAATDGADENPYG